jgi:hypothetical protein
MDIKIAVTICALLLIACDNKSEVGPADKSNVSFRVDSCDLRKVVGTCEAYDLSEMDDWYVEYVKSGCPRNRRGNLFGEYKKSSNCPSENRVARCEGIIEDPTERYEYDKHYYAGTADGYSWKPADVQVTCEKVSGHFIPE